MFKVIQILFNFFRYIGFYITTLISKLRLSLSMGKTLIGKRFLSKGVLFVDLKRGSELEFGEFVIFNNATRHNPVGLNKRSSISVLNGAKLKVGHHTGFSNVSIYCAISISIGDYCKFGGNCFIWDTDFHEMDYQKRRKDVFNSEYVRSLPVVIGNDVFVGANTIILKNVTIGDRAIVGAGSVVTKSIPSDEIWAGNPARFIKKIIH